MFLLGFISTLFTPSVLTAESEGGVVVSEVMWAGSEYIELYNRGDQGISLKGWRITRQKTEEGEEVTVAKISSDKEVLPGEYFLLQEDGASSVSPDESRSSLTLVDDGELLRLYDDAGELVDRVNRLQSDGGWFAGSKEDGGFSMERVSFDADGVLSESWVLSTNSVGGRHGSPGDGSWVPGPSVSPSPTPLISHPPEEEKPLPVWPEGVVLYEFLPNPKGSDAEGEFIELRNTGEQVADIGGWLVDDAEGGSSPYVIPAGTVVNPGEILLLRSQVTGIALNNSGDEVRILNSEGTVYKTVPYTSSSEGVSYVYERGAYVQTTSVTPGAENVIIAPATLKSTEDSDQEEDEPQEVGDISDLVVINEWLPNPEGPDAEGEFIELYNTGSSEVRLSGWKLDDIEGGSKPYVFPAGFIIPAHGYVVLERSETRIALNNSDETVRLIDPLGSVVSRHSFEGTAPEGVSYARNSSGEYVQTITVTEGVKNSITPVPGAVLGDIQNVLSIQDARKAALGAIVTVEGVVNVPPGVLGKTLMYLSGLQVYFSKAEWPSTQLGDRVRVTGKLSSAGGETKVNIAAAEDVVVVVSDEEEPVPQEVATGGVTEDVEGLLVRIRGSITRSSGSTFYVNDGSGDVRVVIKDSTNIVKPRTSKGMTVDIVGIVSETKSGYRVLPRYQEDVRFGSAVVSSTTKKSSTASEARKGGDQVSKPSQKVDFGEGALSYVASQQVGQASGGGRRSVFFLVSGGLALMQLVAGVSAGEPLIKRSGLVTKEQWQ